MRLRVIKSVCTIRVKTPFSIGWSKIQVTFATGQSIQVTMIQISEQH